MGILLAFVYFGCGHQCFVAVPLTAHHGNGGGFCVPFFVLRTFDSFHLCALYSCSIFFDVENTKNKLLQCLSPFPE
jgi:hypothetical protein